MGQENLILKMQSVYNQFTRAERKVADYCLSHREEVLFLSITDLAEACGVGEASVFRFCRTLELSGYQEFKMQLSLSRQGEGAQLPGADDAGLARRMLSAHQKAIADTCQMLDPAMLKRMLDLIQEAKRVYFFGISDSLLVAMAARNKFLRITGKVLCVEDSHMMAVTATMLSEKDLVIMVSYSGATRDVIQIARLAKQAKAKVGALTYYRKSPLTDYADAVLLCGGQEGPLDRGSLAATAGQMYLVDLLYQGYYERNQAQSRENKEKAIAAVVDKVL